MAQIGQTSLPQPADGVIVRNVPADSSVYVGAWVYMDASGTLQNAKADAAATSLVYGLVEVKPTTTTANVKIFGLTLEGTFAGLTPGAQYFLSPTVAGGHTTTVPIGASENVAIVAVGHTATRLNVRILLRLRRA